MVDQVSREFPDLTKFKDNEAFEIWHKYLLLIGKVRAQFSIPQKHWWHVALIPSLHGLTTGLLEHNGVIFEIEINFYMATLSINYPESVTTNITLKGQSSKKLHSQLSQEFQKKKIVLDIDQAVLSDLNTDQFSISHAKTMADTLHFINHAFTHVRNPQREETGPVLLWPHHFDIAFLWFSGRLIPDSDPADAEHSDEQMNIGFSFGDDSVPEAYFYISAYPWQQEFIQGPLPEGAYWHTDGFNAAVLPAKILHANNNPQKYLQDFTLQVIETGKQLMSGMPD